MIKELTNNLVSTNTYKFNSSNIFEIVTDASGKKLRETNTLKNALAAYASYISPNFLNNLSYYCKLGEIEITVPNLSEENWNGELYIKRTGITTINLINHIIGMSHADEIKMENTKYLRLWWD